MLIVDLLTDHIYIPAHFQNQLNLGQNTNNLLTCIYLCQNHEYCRTAVFDELNLFCTLFEECSTVGRIVSQIQSTVLSFLVCDGEPDYLAFSPPIAPVLMQTVLSNMINTPVLPISSTYDIVTIGNHLYLPADNSNHVKMYDTDTYTALDDFIFPESINGTYYHLDRTGTFCYLNFNGSAFSLYSSITGISTSVNTYAKAIRICFSTSFVVTIRSNYFGVDVYLRTTNNFAAGYAYSIILTASVAPCVILNDQLLILISTFLGNGLIQTINLNLTGHSPITTLPMPTWAPVIGRATVNIDAAGRIYVQTNNSYALVVYTTSEQMLGRLPGKNWLEVAGKASKYKFRILTGNTIFEYDPSV
jgi:hypothetical protein